MNSKIDTIIFDVGGVLLPNYNEFIKKDIAKTLDIKLDAVELAWGELMPKLGSGKINEKEFWHEFKTLTKFTSEIKTDALLFREMDNRYATFSFVSDIVHGLKKYKLGIISDTIEAHSSCLAKHGLFKPFSVKIFSHEVGFRKPNPEIYKIALERLNSIAENTIFIDDDKKNVEAAQSLGFNGIVFTNDLDLKKDLEEFGIIIESTIEKQQTNVGAHAIIISKNGNVLLQQKTSDPSYKYSGKIGVFGGALDEGEDLTVGLRRELLEELELDINDYKLKKLGVYEKTKEVDGIDFSIHTWIVFDVDESMLKLHEGESIVSEKAEIIINNPNLTRITRLALQDYLNQ